MSINPKIFEIIEGKLYLFYNFLGANTLEIWQKEDPKAFNKRKMKIGRNRQKLSVIKIISQIQFSSIYPKK